MFHVLIIDDHLDQRELIRFLLTKHHSDWQITEADNGKDALAMFFKQRIDFIITDVKMPFITGIEFAEAIRKENTTVPILFISGYDQFDFVKKALTLQAVNYLLKPINPTEFNEQLDRLADLLQQQQQADTKATWIATILRKDALTKLCHGINFSELTQDEQQQVAPLLTKKNYLLIFDLVNEAPLQSQNTVKLLEELSHNPVIQVSPNRFLLFCESSTDIEAFYKKATIQKQFTLNTEEKVSAFISQPIKEPQALYHVYQRLSQTISQTFYNTNNQPNSKIDLPTRTPLAELTFFQALTDLIHKNYYSDVVLLLRQTLEDYQRASLESPAIVKFFFANVYKQLLEIGNIDLPHSKQTIKELLEATHFKIIDDLFDELFKQLTQRETLIKMDSSDYIREVKEYIFNYYADELTLETIAREINITPKYLSELFIKEEGLGISKFIKELRLTKAKELLTTSNKRIIDISQQTGFNNHSYFIKTFREAVGMTPDSYRKSKKR